MKNFNDLKFKLLLHGVPRYALGIAALILFFFRKWVIANIFILNLFALLLIFEGTISIAYSVFPAGERGTKHKQRKKEGFKYVVAMVDSVLFRIGIQNIIIGYALQIICELVKIKN